MSNDIPSLDEIRYARETLGRHILETPVWRWHGLRLEQILGEETEVLVKLELLQHTGTFKPRGALLNILNLSTEARLRGVTAVSAGNHAIAVAFAARLLGTTAKVVMPKGSNPIRIEQCRAYGGEVVLTDDMHQAFDEVKRIETAEKRVFVHPFEGKLTALGTATVGFEWCRQAPGLDAVIVPIGGGGLCAGIATAVKHMQPGCQVYGVEPEGADTMHRSFAAGKPQGIDQVRTIADSLGAPYALPYSFDLCRRAVDALVKVSDDDLRRAMRLLFHGLKFAVEPAGAAATAALCGPLRDKLRGQRVGVILCGSNIDVTAFASEIGKLDE